MNFLIKKIVKKILPKQTLFLIKKIYCLITNNYILSKPIGNKKKYLELYNKEIKKKYRGIENYQNNLTKKNSIFINKLALLTQISLNKNEINFQHGKVIFYELKKYLNKYKKKIKKFIIFEIGTAKGFSAVIMSKAIFDTKANAKIISLDIIPNDQKIYWNSISDHLIGKINRLKLLDNYKIFLKRINFINQTSSNFFKKKKIKRIHFAFIDADHDYDAVKNDYLQILLRQKKGDIIIFDDYTPKLFSGVVKLVNEIKNNQTYKVKIIYSSIYRGYAICYKN